MSFMKPSFRRAAASYSLALVWATLLGVVPRTVTAAVEKPGAENPGGADKREPVDQKEKGGRGRFVSFKDGVLVLESNSMALVSWNNIGQATKIFKWDVEANAYKQLDAGAEALKQVKAGTWVTVSDGKAIIRIGSRSGRTTGTFISFKDERLLILGKDLGESYTKKYGNNLHMHKFRDDVPAYESIDGGEFKLVGMANKVLPSVKEGTIITVHGEGDDNIVLVQIGVPKKQ
jgi:hypothetical protein